jgi:hypothetical protein
MKIRKKYLYEEYEIKMRKNYKYRFAVVQC